MIPQSDVRRYTGSQDQPAKFQGELSAFTQGGERDEEGCVGDSGVGVVVVVGVAERVPRRRLIGAARDTHT